MIDIAERPALQQPEYPNPARLERVVHRLGQMPGLVTPLEIRQLKAELARAAAGKAFVLQGGDCAERFAETNPARIRNRIRVMLQMSLVLVHGLGLPIIRIGRFAGQYAKPRS
ncbi:MAG: 3-deoxy-7-phosphoheptulonate synthase class II, partial [Bacteroidetes bacterium]|nr:3-deoxy-7-phosphoheptulonate synthase class II [Bacteroidota bacterium]